MRWSAKKLKNFILKEVRLLEKHAQAPHQAMGMHGVDDDYYSDEDLGMMHVHMHHHEDEEEMHPYDRADAMHDEDHGLDMPHGAMPDYQNPMDDHMSAPAHSAGEMYDDLDDDYYGGHMGGEEHDLGPAHMHDEYAGFKDLHLYEADEDEDEADLKEVDELEEEDEVDEAGCGSSGGRRGGMYEEDELEEGEDEAEKLEEGLRRWQKLAGLLRG